MKKTNSVLLVGLLLFTLEATFSGSQPDGLAAIIDGKIYQL